MKRGHGREPSYTERCVLRVVVALRAEIGERELDQSGFGAEMWKACFARVVRDLRVAPLEARSFEAGWSVMRSQDRALWLDRLVAFDEGHLREALDETTRIRSIVRQVLDERRDELVQGALEERPAVLAAVDPRPDYVGFDRVEALFSDGALLGVPAPIGVNMAKGMITLRPYVHATVESFAAGIRSNPVIAAVVDMGSTFDSDDYTSRHDPRRRLGMRDGVDQLIAALADPDRPDEDFHRPINRPILGFVPDTSTETGLLRVIEARDRFPDVSGVLHRWSRLGQALKDLADQPGAWGLYSTRDIEAVEVFVMLMRSPGPNHSDLRTVMLAASVGVVDARELHVVTGWSRPRALKAIERARELVGASLGGLFSNNSTHAPLMFAARNHDWLWAFARRNTALFDQHLVGQLSGRPALFGGGAESQLG